MCIRDSNPAGTISYLTGTPLSAGDDPRLAADIAACVPINPFGEGSVTDAARNYVLVDSLATGKITQFNVGGFVAGDTSEFFNLPGGPVSFSVGAEYRRETLDYDLDDLTQEGYAFYNAIPALSLIHIYMCIRDRPYPHGLITMQPRTPDSSARSPSAMTS